MMKLIRNPANGEQALVNSLDGYDGWEVIEEGVARPRGDCIRENGRWKVCRASQEKAARVRRYHELGRQGVIELLDTLEKKVALFENLEKRMEALEKKGAP